MTKARQRERAKRRKEFARIPMSRVHGYVNGVEQPIQYWDGKRIQFVTAPPEDAIITILVDDPKGRVRVTEGDPCL